MTKAVPADEIQALGRQQVAHIRNEMRITLDAHFGGGDITAFLRHINEEPAYTFATEDDVLLRAWAIHASKPTDRTIVLTHGWGDNKGDMLRRFHFLRDRFNLFFLDTRAHGESAGEHSSIGYLE